MNPGSLMSSNKVFYKIKLSLIYPRIDGQNAVMQGVIGGDLFAMKILSVAVNLY